jgi:hypothetical protein
VSDKTISMSIPLDSDGFLRNECPTCEREFKSRPTAEDVEPVPVPESGYFCPYCAVQAPTNAWLTKAQVEAANAQVFDEVLKPELDKFADSARRAATGFLKIDVKTTGPDAPAPLTEVDDMRRVDFSCHPTEPIKVLEDWQQAVHCIICGQAPG